MENKLDSIVLIYIMLEILHSGVGRVTPAKIKKNMNDGGVIVTDYFVRKVFAGLHNAGILAFHHNHYKLDMASDVLIELHLLTNEIFEGGGE